MLFANRRDFVHINYKKKFIILKNKYSNIKGCRPKGHMKLEIKGAHTNINISIENAEANSSYSLTLITDEIVELGKIYTDAYGRARSELSLNSDDFLQGELEEGAVVIHRDKDILLGEYIDKDDRRIEEFIQGLETQEGELDSEPEPVPTSASEPEPAIELEPVPEPEQEIELEPEVETEQEIVVPDEEFHVEREFYEEVIEIPPEEEEIQMGESQENSVEDVNLEYDKVYEENETGEIGQKEYVDLEYEHNVKRMEQTNDYVLSILRYFPYEEPFAQELLDHNWWRIEYNNEAEGFLPYFNFVANTNAIELMKKYNHYLFGLFNHGDRVKYYIYAIPGEFTLEEHPDSGMSGFKTWFEGVEEVGYWLLYIDPLTGRIVEPMDPMNPS